MTVTVLVVEDDEMVRRLAARMLTLEGYYVLEARSGDDALGILRRFAPGIRVVVTDLAMPGVDGRNLGMVIRRCWPHIRVLYMSGYPAAQMLHSGALDDGQPFLQKPFTSDQLGRKVRELLGASSGE